MFLEYFRKNFRGNEASDQYVQNQEFVSALGKHWKDRNMIVDIFTFETSPVVNMIEATYNNKIEVHFAQEMQSG